MIFGSSLFLYNNDLKEEGGAKKTDIDHLDERVCKEIVFDSNIFVGEFESGVRVCFYQIKYI